MRPKEKYIRAPEIIAARWFNSPPISIKDLKDKVLLVDFWDYTCINCIRTLPYIKEWHKRYAGDGLVIIGVHAPEFTFAKEAAWVEEAIKRFGLEYKIALDNNYDTWQAFANRYWPAKYLFNRDGYLRYYHFGEGAYSETELEIRSLLLEIKPDLVFPQPIEFLRATDRPGASCYPVTPELYLGYERGRLGNEEGYEPGAVVGYNDTDEHEPDTVYCYGEWLNRSECLELARDADAYLSVIYSAAEVNAVMSPGSRGEIRVIVTQDEHPVSRSDRGSDLQESASGETFVCVDRPRMYNLIKNRRFGSYELKLACSKKGLCVYAFTFVSCVVE